MIANCKLVDSMTIERYCPYMSIERWKETRTRIKSHRKGCAYGSVEYNRLSRLMGLVATHINKLGNNLVPSFHNLARMDVLTNALSNGDKIEWPRSLSSRISEIGLVVIENGKETAYNIQIGGYSHAKTVLTWCHWIFF